MQSSSSTIPLTPITINSQPPENTTKSCLSTNPLPPATITTIPPAPAASTTSLLCVYLWLGYVWLIIWDIFAFIIHYTCVVLLQCCIINVLFFFCLYSFQYQINTILASTEFGLYVEFSICSN